MNKALSSILLIFGICASSLAAEKNRTVSFPRCEVQEASAVAASVKRDYLQKQVFQWKDDQEILGQQRRKRTARAVLTGMCYSAGSAMRHGSSS
ncbi:hypothetical protein IXX05_19740, partial [Escherichia coli]